MSFVTELQRERCRGSQSHAVAHRAAGARPLNVLMVSRSEAWSSAVRAAICDAGADLVTCAAHEAVTRLAGTASHYTHLLVRDHDADGLTGVLADMTTEIARPDTKMLMLGGKIDASARTSRAIRVISAADPRVVQEALMNSPARLRPDVALAPAELRAALEDGVIEARYQPIIRVADRRPVGVEALARLVHPTLGLMQPDRFVPQIEAAGLAPQFTALVSARVFADLLGPGLAGTGLRVSVNFPLDVLQSPAALRRLEQQRAAAGIPADRVIVELTESQPVRNIEALRQAVTTLRRIGYGVAIDDVGPAVPHLGPMLTLPFSSIKLDKGLVSQADTDTAVLRYLSETVREAHRLNLAIVAEGVETEATWARMRAIGVTHVQGFLAARPLPRTAVPVWMRAWSGQHG